MFWVVFYVFGNCFDFLGLGLVSRLISFGSSNDLEFQTQLKIDSFCLSCKKKYGEQNKRSMSCLIISKFSFCQLVLSLSWSGVISA